MAGGRRLGARARRGGGGFYSWAQCGGGASLCAKATKLWCGPRHGWSTAERGGDVRRPSANGGAWAARRGQCTRTTWLGQGPTDVMHRDQGARRTDRWAWAGLGVRVRPVRWHADAAGLEQRSNVARAGRSGFGTISK
jgi:hypothetical protein